MQPLVRASFQITLGRGGLLSGVRHSLLQSGQFLLIEVHDMKHDLLDAAEDTQPKPISRQMYTAAMGNSMAGEVRPLFRRFGSR